ncbi:MAG: lysylphosphatidylglycerol synthase domain-containing protein [Beutenbergiaceae bacterium]
MPGTDSNAPRRAIRVVDTPMRRQRRPVDLMLLLGSLVGIVVVLILGVYADRTTSGVIQDLQASPLQTVIDVVRSILLLPINVIEGWLLLILPLVVITERLVRRHPRSVIEALVAATAAALLAWGASWLIESFGTPSLTSSLRIWQNQLDGSGGWVLTLTPALAALSALLTATGTRDRSRIIAISWNLIWIVMLVAVLTRTSTITGALVSVLIGRAVGLGTRYLFGVLSERARGADLVAAIRRSGIDPVSVVRIGSGTNVNQMSVDTVVCDTPIGYAIADPQTGSPLASAALPEPAIDPGAEADPDGALPPPAREPLTDTAVRGIAAELPESATVAIEQEGTNRVYAVLDTDGNRWDAVVLDRDRQVIGMLAWAWSALRLQGLGRRNAVSLRQAADHAVLMTYAAAAAGVRSPALHGIARAEESILMLGEHVDGAQSLSDYSSDQITDSVMAEAWQQLGHAHAAGLSHRNLSAETVLLIADGGQAGSVFLNGWEQGDIASSTVSRRLDQVQMLTLFAVRVGAERACAAAAAALGAEQLAALAPLLQSVALPPHTRNETRRDKSAMRDLRTAVAAYLPDTDGTVPLLQLTRFNTRTVVTVTVAVAAAWIVLTTLNFEAIVRDAANANVGWLIAAFCLGLLTYLGSALGLVAYSPVRLGLWRTLLVQVAASVIGLVAPAGVGPAALNLRFMHKRGLDTPMAVATVALLQLSQIVTTVLLLLTIVLLTGGQGAFAQLPSGIILVILAAIAALIGLLFAIPRLRRWLLAKIRPTIRQVLPRLIWVLGQPRRLLMGIGGNLLITAGFLSAFAATLAAFDVTLPLTTLAVVYLTGNTVGSAVPTPGGIGAVEGALFTGLRTVGITTATATSVAVLFRVLTFWIRVPLGWLALRHLQKRQLV